jgi:ribosomal protein S6--L-glutamate ligase
MNILILTTNPKGISTKHLIAACKKKGHTPTIYKPADLYINCSNVTGHDKLYIKEKRIYAKNIDAVIPRTGGAGEYGATIVRQLNENMNIYSTVTADGILYAADKIVTTQKLSKAGVLVPKTTFIQKPNKSEFNYLMNTVGGLPTVCKLQRGSQGDGVFIIETPLAGSTTLNSFATLRTNLILQQFVETSKNDEQKNDIRAFVVGDEVVAAMKRMSVKGDFRSNYSLSKEAYQVTLTDEEKEQAVKAAKTLNLGVAGVDLMRDSKTDKTYVIEVNSNPSLAGITAVTGIDVAGKIIDHIVYSVNGKKAIEKIVNNKQTDFPMIVAQQLFGGELDLNSQKVNIDLERIAAVIDLLSLLKEYDEEYSDGNLSKFFMEYKN